MKVAEENFAWKEPQSRKIRCAQWMNQTNLRQVLFIKRHRKNDDSHQMQSMMEKHIYNSLQRNGFFVDYFTRNDVNQKMMQRGGRRKSGMSLWIKGIDYHSYHRIFYFIDEKDEHWMNDKMFSSHLEQFTEFEIWCKLRIVIDNSNNNTTHALIDSFYKENGNIESFFSRKQIILGHPDKRGTFLSSFVFDDDDMRRIRMRIAWSDDERSQNERVGLIRYDTKFEDVMTFLLDALCRKNITLHVVCGKDDSVCFEEQKQYHRNDGIFFHEEMLLDKEYSKLLSTSSFTIGINAHWNFKTVWNDMAHGNTVINIITSDDSTIFEAPFKVAEPYYKIHKLTDIDIVLTTVEGSLNQKVKSFIPSELHSGTMDDRVCAILEDDSLCSCPNPTFKVSGSTRNEFYKRFGDDSRLIDCRSNLDAKKESIFDEMERLT